MMKSISGKFIVLIILVLLLLVPMRQSSAQFECITGGGGGGGEPTPTPTPTCYDEWYEWTHAYCDYVQGFCCTDTYLVVNHYCFGVLEYSETTLLYHDCIEI